MKIIVVSDVHLGSEMCDKEGFNEFLRSIHDDKDVTDLVLLGDIVDMWRRDASGVFLENMDTIQLIKDLQKRILVHVVAGNHDYHLLKLKNQAPHYHYPFEFKETLELVDEDHTYRFMHGYEFEYGNELKYIRPVMDLLCHMMSDSEGPVEEELWVYLARKIGDLQYSVFTHHMERDKLNMMTRSLVDGPQERLKDKLEDIERRAYGEVRGKFGQMLIFGHTHHPFINKEGNLVNTGSWVSDATPHNTFIELKGGVARLFVFGGEEIKDRLDIIMKDGLAQDGSMNIEK